MSGSNGSGSATVGSASTPISGDTTGGIPQRFVAYSELTATQLNNAFANADIVAGTIDNTIIGSDTPSIGNFTVLTAETVSQGDNSNNVATTAFVTAAIGAGGGGGGGGSISLVSPAFTGNPTAPTQPSTDNSTRLATTAFVKNVGYATLNSPVFTGNPQAPSPSVGDSSTALATTSWVKSQGYGSSSGGTTFTPGTALALVGSTLNVQIGTASGTVAAGNDSRFAAMAGTSSPAFTGTPTAPTPTAATNNTQIATTAFVQAQKASPAFTGTPTAPTPASTDNTTNIATTAYVKTNLSSTFNGTGVAGLVQVDTAGNFVGVAAPITAGTLAAGYVYYDGGSTITTMPGGGGGFTSGSAYPMINFAFPATPVAGVIYTYVTQHNITITNLTVKCPQLTASGTGFSMTLSYNSTTIGPVTVTGTASQNGATANIVIPAGGEFAIQFATVSGTWPTNGSAIAYVFANNT